MPKTYKLSAAERENGSVYFTCPALPGFHYLLAPGEDIEKTLIPAFKQFLGLSLTMATLTIHEKDQRFTAELE